MSKSLIKEVTIKVSASDLGKASTEAEKLVNRLLDSGTAAEVIHRELNGISKTLSTITKKAEGVKSVFDSFTLGKKVASELNQVLEGLNRIKSAAKDLKGLNVGVDLNVGNITAMQNQISKSLQGLDISINLKAGNINATNDRLNSIVNSLLDAGVAVELLNSALGETAAKLAIIKNDAGDAAIDLAKISISKNFESGIDHILHALNNINEEIVDFNLNARDAFESLDRSVDKVDDSLAAINTTLQRTKFASKESAKNTGLLADHFTKTGYSVEDYSKKLGDAVRGTRNQSRMMGDLAKIAGPIPALFAIISAHVWALQSAFEALSLGDQLNRLEKLGTTIGAEVGLPIQKLARDMVEVTNGAISYEEALRKAANASGYGFSSKELEKMTEVARRASVVMGVDMNDALNRIIRGVSKQEIELLDELGITIRLTEAQSAYSKELNISSDSLTSYQKQQAYLNAVLKQSEKSFGYLSDSDLGATNVEKLGAAVSSLTSRFTQLLALGTNKLLSFLEEDSINNAGAEVDKVTKSIGAMIASIEKAKKNGNIASTITLSSDAISGYDTLSKKMAELEDVMRSGGLEVEVLNGKIQSTKQLFIATEEDTDKAKTALKEYVRYYEEYVAVQEQQDMIARELAASLGYVGLSMEKQKQMIKQLSDSMNSLRTVQKTSAEGVSTFRSSLIKQQTPLDQYNSSLESILSAYEEINKIKVKFPLIPDSVLNKMMEMADAAATAAGYTGSADVSNALARGKEYKSFQKNVLEKESQSSSRTSLQNMSNVTGAAELKNAEEILRNRKAELDLFDKDVANGKESLITDERRLELQNAIAEGELEVAKARQALVATSNQLNVEDSKRNNLFMEYSRMSSAEYSVRKLMNDLTDAENLLDIQNSTNVALEQRYQTETEILQLKAQIRRANIEANLAEIDRLELVASAKTATETYLNYMNGVPTAINEAASAQDRLNAALDRQRVITEAFNKGDSGYKEVDVLNADLAVQQAKLEAQQAKEAAVRAKSEQNIYKLNLDSANLNLGELEVAKARLDIEDELLRGLKESKASQTAINEQVLARAEAEREVNDIISQRHRDLAAGAIGAIQGENMMQYTSTTGMGAEAANLARQQDGLANINNSFQQLAEFDQPFANVAANLSQMAIAIQDNASAMQIASMAGQTITSMFQMNGAAAVDAIDAQIAAEKKRDGTSEESLAKIKALEAKKIEATRKTARQTIIMQTAVGVANALAMGNPLIGIPMAIAVSAMGLQALKAADSAAESSLAELDSTATTSSLTLGDRTNKVDTAQTANSGELSYIQGSSGVGSIQNFTPRASGNNMYAGHAYIAGEHGPELIQPNVNSIASSASETAAASGSSVGNTTLNIQTLDARSFQDLVMTNPQLFRQAVEVALNQEGKKL